jgi:PAS domain S-box-containing protein
VSTLPFELRSFIDRVPALAWSALPDGSVDFCNRRFQEYTGFSSVQLHGSGWRSAVHGDDVQQLDTWWQSLQRSPESKMAEVRLRRSDGEYRWFQIAASPIYDDQAKLVRWCGVNADIHELKCAEQKLREEKADLSTSPTRSVRTSWSSIPTALRCM